MGNTNGQPTKSMTVRVKGIDGVSRKERLCDVLNRLAAKRAARGKADPAMDMLAENLGDVVIDGGHGADLGADRLAVKFEAMEVAVGFGTKRRE